MDIKGLFEGVCTLTFEYEDGSRVTSLTSLNPEILVQYGVASLDGIVDLEIRRPIPQEVLGRTVRMEPRVTEGQVSALDKLVGQGGKTGW